MNRPWIGRLLRIARSGNVPADLSPLAPFEPGTGGPDRSHALYISGSGAFWLLPKDPRRRSGALGLYSPHSFLGRRLRTLMRRGWLSRGEVRLSQERLDSLISWLSPLAGTSDLELGFAVGPPRARQKVVVAAIDERGRDRAYVKLAFDEKAKQRLRVEARVLARLAENELTRGRVPRVLARFDWRGGEALALESGPVANGPRRLGNVHVDFLERLYRSSRLDERFESTDWWARISTLRDTIDPALKPEQRAVLESAAGLLLGAFGGWNVPTFLAHRDFAPWNTRLGGNDLFVLDWESADTVVGPLMDLYHFQVVRAALLGGFVGRANPGAEVLHRLWPDGTAHQRQLWIGYLLETFLSWTALWMEGPEDADTRVERWVYSRLREEFR